MDDKEVVEQRPKEELLTHQQAVDEAYVNRRFGTYSYSRSNYEEVLLEQEELNKEEFEIIRAKIAEMNAQSQPFTAADVIVDFPPKKPDGNEVLTDNPDAYPLIVKLANRKIFPRYDADNIS